VKLAVIGTGNVGGNLGARLSRAGFAVRFGAQSADTKDLLARCGGDAAALDVPAAAAWGDIVFFAVPGNVVVELARSLASALAGKVVVDCTNALTWNEGPVWAPPAEGSLTAAIAKAVPQARVVKAFNTFGAEHHADPERTGAAAHLFMAGDDSRAKQMVGEIASRAGFRPVDAGPLRNAAVLENLAILWIHLATVGGHGRNFVFAMQEKQ